MSKTSKFKPYSQAGIKQIQLLQKANDQSLVLYEINKSCKVIRKNLLNASVFHPPVFPAQAEPKVRGVRGECPHKTQRSVISTAQIQQGGILK